MFRPFGFLGLRYTPILRSTSQDHFPMNNLSSSAARVLVRSFVLGIAAIQLLLGLILTSFGILEISSSFGNLVIALLYLVFGLYLLNHVRIWIWSKRYSEWYDLVAKLKSSYHITRQTAVLTLILALGAVLLPLHQAYPLNLVYLLPVLIASEFLYRLSIQVGRLSLSPFLTFILTLVPVYLELLYLHYWARAILGVYRKIRSRLPASRARASYPKL